MADWYCVLVIMLVYHIPCYESAAKEEKRKNLANCRSGEYEGLKQKLVDPSWKPDFGPRHSE